MVTDLEPLSSKTCPKCGETKLFGEFHKDKSRKDGKFPHCRECVKEGNKKDYQIHREERKEYNRNYKREHKDEIRKQQGHLPMYENKLCSSYLGVVIAERLCRHLFKDVEVMPYGNTGYDIVCNKGMKIDIKSATMTLQKSKHPQWGFNIDHNTIADFFILVAFDNLTDLNPLHLWMIPGKEINNNSSKTIRSSTVHKWDKWKRDIKDAQLCCTEMKNKNTF